MQILKLFTKNFNSIIKEINKNENKNNLILSITGLMIEASDIDIKIKIHDIKKKRV